MRVLLVDDIPAIRDMLRMLLGLEEGFEIVGEAANGLEAIQAAAELEPDLIVMDLHMPVMNGIEATRRITDNHPDIKVVAFTSSDAPDMNRALEDAGVVAHLAKGETGGLLAVLRSLRDEVSAPQS
jgi:DNA-binding NarL/FixJ family response regulator